MLLRQFVINYVPMSDSRWAAKLIGDLGVDNVKSLAQQSDVGRRFVTKEFSVPDPWLTFGRLFGGDHENWAIVDFKVVPDITVPVSLLPGEWFVSSHGERSLKKTQQ
jgi:hypothetical protein